MAGRHLRRARALVACLAIFALAGCSLSRTPFTARRTRPKPRPPTILAPEETAEDPGRTGAADDDAPAAEDGLTRRRRSYRAIRRDEGEAERPPLPLESARAAKLAESVAARAAPLAEPCLDAPCAALALDRVTARLVDLESTHTGTVRVLHLGDALVAADSIAVTARRWLQYRFGGAGRGFVAIDQRAEDGGRHLQRSGWTRLRAADLGREGERFGFAGSVLESQQTGAKLTLALDEEDADLVLYFDAHPGGPRLDVVYEGVVIGELDTGGAKLGVRTRRFRLPSAGKSGRATELGVVAKGAGARLLGASFEARRPGVLYDAVGPDEADAHLYATLDQDAFREHLRALSPDLVIISVGAADAAALGKGARTLDEVRADHEKLLIAVRDALPESDCMVWTPLEALAKTDAGVKPRPMIAELRGLQRALAERNGCAVWDLATAMGGSGAVARWHDAGLMSDDLGAPKLLGGEVLGHLFAKSFLAAYAGE